MIKTTCHSQPFSANVPVMENTNTQNQTAEAMAELQESAETATEQPAAAQPDNVTQLQPEAATNEPNWKEEAAKALAELENSRKRHAKELSDARNFAVSRFAQEMLNVADNITRAQSVMPETAEGDVKNIKEGVAMVAHQFQQSLEKFQIKQISTVGAQLNPDQHQAMQKAPSDKPEGEIIAEMQAGYMIGERLLRPALVVVSNGEAPTE